MSNQAIDQAFLKLNDRLHLVSGEQIAAAQKTQVDEMFSGRAPRPLLVILRDKNLLSPEAIARIQEYMEGGKELPPAEQSEETSDLWMKTPQSIFEMSPRPQGDPPADLESLEESLVGGISQEPKLPPLTQQQELEMAQEAVRRGMITQAQLRECLSKQLDEITKIRRKDAAPKTPEPKLKRSLVEVLLERGYLTRQQIAGLLGGPDRAH